MENTAYVINGYSIDLDEFGETWEVRGAAGSVVYYTRSQRLAEAFARENGFPPVPSVTITPRGAVLVDRTGHRSLWPVADLLYIARSEDSAEMQRDIADATWRVRGL